MTKLLLMIGAAALALSSSPALAQHQHHGHHAPAPKAKAPKKAATKKPGPKKAAAKKAAPKKAAPKKKRPVKKKVASGKPAAAKARPAAPTPDPHAGHTAPTPAPAPDPHAGHAMPAPDPHAGHSPSAAADPHAGHQTAAIDPPIGPPPAEAFTGPEHAADLFWDPAAQAQSRRGMRREHGGLPAYRLLFDRVETQVGKGGDSFQFDGDAWFGGDIDKLWLKAEAEGEWGKRLESAEVQALWSHAIDPWFDVQAGIRADLRPDTRTYVAVGVQGLAPYWIEVDAAAFLSDKGNVTARIEAEHDVRITQRLVLQPRAEIELALQDVPEQQVGAGLSTVELGARLRYQIRPELAPYVGLSFERATGDTRRLRRLEGEEEGGVNLLVGIRAWF